MKKVKFNKKAISIKNESKVYLGVISVLFILFTMLFIKSIRQPLQHQEKITENKIVQKANITYSTEALPDGMTSMNGTIFSKAQKSMKVHIASNVNSEKPVSITGEGMVYCDLIAEGLWTQSIPISSKIKIDSTGSENTIINSDFQINFADVKSRIDKAESQIVGTSPGKYILKIRPDFKANIVYEDKKILLDNSYELSFEYSYSLIKLTGENKEFIKSMPIEKLTTTNSVFILLGMPLSLVLCRVIFSISTLILLIIIIVNVKGYKLDLRRDAQSANYIDRKYGGRIINLQQEPKIENKILLPLTSFKELIRVADEKDLNILKYYKIDSNIVTYVVIDGECIFNYEVSSVEDAEGKKLISFTLGSDSLNG